MILNTFSQKISEHDLIKVLPLGNIKQYPPIYSAKKINGKKLYEYARNNENVEIKPSDVTIYESKLISYDYEHQCAEIFIKCSKGTYIRSIANDIGNDLNNGCYLSRLKRTQAGPFKVENSINITDISSANIKEKIINPLEVLNQKTQELNDTEYKRISHGMNIYNRIDASKNETILLSKDKNLIAISKAEENGLKPQKVLI